MFCVRQPHDTTMFGSGGVGALMGIAVAAPLQSLKRRRRGSLEQEEQGVQQYEAHSEENGSAKVFCPLRHDAAVELTTRLETSW